jgi:hypothetical protein
VSQLQKENNEAINTFREKIDVYSAIRMKHTKPLCEVKTIFMPQEMV